MDHHDASISYPGAKWKLRWLDGPILDYLQLDVVGFLAILGEDAVKTTSKLASLSWLFCLPRLIPAPHVLLYAERPEEHDVIRAKVTGVDNGLHRNELSTVTAALFASMPAYSVRCFEIGRKPEVSRGASRLRATYTGPVILVNIFGCALSIALFIASLVWGDGFSLVATILLSVLSTLVGLTNHWSLHFGTYGNTRTPPGDTVIRFPNGAFLIIKCDESVARELFFPQNNIDYTLEWANGFMFVSLGGTVILMLSVIMLANARIELQLAWGAAYILLNIGHWLAAALPKRLNWDFSAYNIQERELDTGPINPNYTSALWKALVFTKKSDWIALNEAMPKTQVWADWLTIAEPKARHGVVEIGDLPSKHASFHHHGLSGLSDGRVVYEVPPWDAKAAWDALLQASEQDPTSPSMV